MKYLCTIFASPRILILRDVRTPIFRPVGILIFCFLIIPFFSCKKDIANPISTTTPTTFSQVFEDFWNDMNINYLYWDIDTTQWAAMHDRYAPVFAKLNLQSANDLKRSVQYFRQISDGLVDHHYFISFSNPVLKDSLVDPAVDNILRSPDFRRPVSYLATDENYLDPGFLSVTDNTTDPTNPLVAVLGTIQGNILFFGCSRFGLSASFHSFISNPVQPLLSNLFSILQNPTGLKGVVLDLRNNPGGDVTDLNFLAGRFIDKSVHFGDSRYKSGNGRLDYTPWIEADILPQTGSIAVKVPIIILADRYSASLAELFTMAMRTLPNCRIVGETTFGATGPLTENGIFNDGSFSVTGFLSVETSSSEFRYLDGKIYEGKGFPPDYPIPFNATALSSGDDTQMDKAVSLLQ